MAHVIESKITEEATQRQRTQPKFERPSINPSNQDTIWPMNKNVLSYEATERIIALSVPPSRRFQKNKHGSLFYMDSMGTPEIFHKMPAHALTFEATPRLKALSRPPERYTLESLHNRKFTSPEEPYSPVTKAALEYITTPRMYTLATPKRDFREPLIKRKPVLYDRNYLERLIEVPSRIPVISELATIIEEPQSISVEYSQVYDARLAQPKPLHKDYLSPVRLEDINKPLPRALTATASDYTKSLAKPKRRDKVYLHPKCHQNFLHSKCM